MKIVDVALFTYRLPFTRPVLLSAGPIAERRGYLIKLTADSGAVGWGDVAPLPGYSAEPLDEVWAALKRLRRNLIDTSISTDDDEPTVRFETEEVDGINEPSVRCGLEMAVLNLLAADSGRSIAEMLCDNPAQEIRLNGLITGDSDPIECARQLRRDGFRTIKLKVGRGQVHEDVERIRAVQNVIGEDVTLRLDANRAWGFDDAVHFAEQVADCRIEYIEEPLSDWARLAEFHEKTCLEVALDESVPDLTPHTLREHSYAGAIILKPTLLGGFERAGALARTAREMGMKAVVSSCFECGVGIAALAQLAAAYGTPFVAAGLDTLDRFQQDLLTRPIQTSGGCIITAQAWDASRSVNESALQATEPREQSRSRRSEPRLPDELPLLMDADRVITRHGASAMVSLLRSALASGGFARGDRIAIVEKNRIELPLLLIACLKEGIVAALISPRFPEATRKAMIGSTGCRAVAVWESPSDGAPPEYGIEKFIAPSSASLSDARTNLSGWDNTASRSVLNDPWTIVFTSGSTGAPKAVLHSVGNHHYNAVGSNRILPVGPGDRWLLSLPLYHVGGLGILYRCFLGGATVVLERPGVDLAYQIVQDHITHLSLVPTQLRRLLRHPNLKQLRSTLKVILLGGAPIPLDLLQQASEAGLPVYPTYGLTEMASQVATGSPERPDKLRVLPHREVKIADDGAICVRGDTLFLGYVTQDGIERPLDAEGWFPTGDTGRIDARGFLHVQGRKDNMFISGGENVRPEAIEAALSSIDGIEEGVVVPVEDAEYGYRPVAFLRYRADFNLSEAGSELTEEARFGFDHHSLSAELEKTLPRFMLPIAYYPWPHGYSPAGIKLDRSFFRDLAARLHRNKR